MADNGNGRWHISRAVSISTILAIGTQTFVFGWWAAHLSAAVDRGTDDRAAMTARIERIELQRGNSIDRLARVETLLEQRGLQLSRIEKMLERLAEGDRR